MSECKICGRKFKTDAARSQHNRDKHDKPPVMTKEGARSVMDDMGDLPDGAFWSMVMAPDLYPEDFLDE